MSKTVKDLKIGEKGYVNSLVYFTKDTEILKYGDILLCRVSNGFIACKEVECISITLKSLKIEEDSTLSLKDQITEINNQLKELNEKRKEVVQKRIEELNLDLTRLDKEITFQLSKAEIEQQALQSEIDYLDYEYLTESPF